MSESTATKAKTKFRTPYLKVFLTFARNSLVRDMSFRANFIFQCLTSICWALMNFGLFKIIYGHANTIGAGWGQSEFFVFLGTIWIINSIVQTFFMANAQEFSELIRTGNLDFALLKPIDTQFLISFPRITWAQVPNGFLGLALIVYYVNQMAMDSEKALVINAGTIFAFCVLVACGAVVMYSVMIVLASTSIWLGRNQQLHSFWFYITNFYRYPMEIYQTNMIGWTLWGFFTFIIPVLVVSNVPARVLAQPTGYPFQSWEWGFAGYAILSAVLSVFVSRWIFNKALLGYRSASS
jgi:ABC-2 type transport system permease protein